MHIDANIVNELNNKVPDHVKRKNRIRPDFESNLEFQNRGSEQQTQLGQNQSNSDNSFDRPTMKEGGARAAEEEKKEEEPISVRDKLFDNPNPLSRMMEKVQDMM